MHSRTHARSRALSDTHNARNACTARDVRPPARSLARSPAHALSCSLLHTCTTLHAHMRTRMARHARARTHARTHACARVCVCMHSCTRTLSRTLCMHTHIHACTHTRTRTRTRAHTHTHTRTQVFDSGEIEFKLGNGEVIEGWEQACAHASVCARMSSCVFVHAGSEGDACGRPEAAHHSA